MTITDMLSFFIVLLCSYNIICVVSQECSISELCNQQTGYLFAGTNMSIVFVHNHACKGRILTGNSCNMCAQLESTKHIHCTHDTYSSSRFTFPSSNSVDQVNIMTYMDNIDNKLHDDKDILEVFNRRIHLIPIDRIDFEGIMEITQPAFGSIIANDLYIEVEYHNLTTLTNQVQQEILVSSSNNRIPNSINRIIDGLQFQFNTIGIIQDNYPGELRHLSSANIEPASWFYTITPIISSLNEHNKENLQYGYPTFGYIEFILTSQQIALHRRFVSTGVGGSGTVNDSRYTLQNVLSNLEHSISNVDSVEESTTTSSTGGSSTSGSSSNKDQSNAINNKLHKTTSTTTTTTTTSTNKELVNVCIWSSNTMDGQKRIWLDQIEHLDREKFKFTWILSLQDGLTTADLLSTEHNDTLNTLKYSKNNVFNNINQLFSKRKNGRVVDSPYNSVMLGIEALEMDPGDGRPSLSQIWKGDELALYR